MFKKSPISIDEIVDWKNILTSIREHNYHKLIFAHLNISSVKNNIDLLAEQGASNIDVFMIPGTKIDESFPVGNVLLPGFSVPYRFNRDSNGGGILLYVREDITSNFLTLEKIPGMLFRLRFTQKHEECNLFL